MEQFIISIYGMVLFTEEHYRRMVKCSMNFATDYIFYILAFWSILGHLCVRWCHRPDSDLCLWYFLVILTYILITVVSSRATGHFCRLMIIFANSLDPDPQYVNWNKHPVPFLR